MPLDVDLSSLTVEEIRTWVQAAITYNCILMPIDKRTYRTEKKSLIAPDGFTNPERIMMWCLNQEESFIQSDDDEEDEEEEISEKEIVEAKRSFRKNVFLKVARNRWFSYPTKQEITMMMCQEKTLEQIFELAKRSFRKNKKSVVAADQWCSINLTKKERMRMWDLDHEEANPNIFDQSGDDEEQMIDKEMIDKEISISTEKEQFVAKDFGWGYLHLTRREIRMIMVEGNTEQGNVAADQWFSSLTEPADQWFSSLTEPEIRMMKCQHAEDHHWAVRPLTIAFVLVALKFGFTMGARLKKGCTSKACGSGVGSGEDGKNGGAKVKWHTWQWRWYCKDGQNGGAKGKWLPYQAYF